MLGLVFAILPVVLPAGLSTAARVVLTGLLVITAVVVVRQLLTFAENEQLVRRAEAALETLRRQEERVRLLLKYSTDITSLIDHTGTMTYLTPATRMLGPEPGELVGVRMISVIHPTTCPPCCPACAGRGRPPGRRSPTRPATGTRTAPGGGWR